MAALRFGVSSSEAELNATALSRTTGKREGPEHVSE